MKRRLLIIDPQNDFCDPNGALSVPGADQSMRRVAEMVRRSKSAFDDIQITLDTHQLVDIAHPIVWENERGESPAPYTTITHADVADGVWRSRDPEWRERVRNYVAELESHQRYQLTIWPPHCLIGSPGHNIFPPLLKALLEWQHHHLATVKFVAKGTNPHTEHYSVVRAEVVDPDDPSTGVNTEFIRHLKTADELLIAGEALSHCVANSVRDIAAEAGSEYVKRLVLLTDASDPVPGFEAVAEEFIGELTAQGMRLAKTTDFFR